MRLHHLLCLRPAADPVRLRVPIRQRPGARRLPDREGGVAAGAPRQHGVVGVPDVRAVLHGADAGGAWGGVVVAGVRPGGGERRARGEERLYAAQNLAECRRCDGQYAASERIQREVLGVMRRVLGEEHPDTLTTAGNLAESLSGQGKYADAERIEREVLGVRRRVLGEEHPDTLAGASNLATSLSGQGKYADAERINREALGLRRRVQGKEHPDALMTANNLATSLLHQGKYADAERINARCWM
jgi:hypothetical protein